MEPRPGTPNTASAKLVYVQDDDLDGLLQRQHGVLSREQALACGLSQDAIQERLVRGKWQRTHRGVYAAFSGRAGREAQLWSAVLRLGPGAVISHQTAAELDGLADRPSEVIHLTTPAGRRPRPVEGVRVHRSRRLDDARHPARLPPRTRTEETVLDLVDAAPTLNEALSWVTRACGRRLTTSQRLLAALRRRTRIRWRAELQEGLADAGRGAQSLLELRYLRNVERVHGLPEGRRQHPAKRSGRQQWDDVVYEKYRTVVELDGRVGHVHDGRWRDMERDNAVAAGGRLPLRYGWFDVTERSCKAASQVAQVLQQSGWTGSPRRCGPSCAIVDDFPGYSTHSGPR